MNSSNNKWREFVTDGHFECDIPNLAETPVEDWGRLRNWVNVNIERIEHCLETYLKEVQYCGHLEDEAEQMAAYLDQGIKGIEDALHSLKGLQKELLSSKRGYIH